MRFLVKLLIFLSVLYLGTALSHAELPYNHLEARAGSKLVIPCHLTIDGVTGDHQIDIEWRMAPPGTHTYMTIMQHSGIKLHLGSTHAIEKDCSFAISPLRLEDSGTYEVHVKVDGVQSGPVKKIYVHVADSPLMNVGKKFQARRLAMFPHRVISTIKIRDEEHVFPVDEKPTVTAYEDQAVPAYERQAVPAYEDQVVPAYEDQAVPAYERQAVPAYEVQVVPAYEGQAVPAYERQAVPAYEGQAVPAYEGQAVPAYEDQAVPAYERQAVPAYEGQAVPAYEDQAVPAYERQAVPAYERQAVPAYERQAVPAYERQAVPAYERQAVPAYEGQAVPAYEDQAVPAYERQAVPAYERQAVPAYERQAVPAYERQAVPAYEHQAVPAFEDQAVPAYERQAVPAYERQAVTLPEVQEVTADEKETLPVDEQILPEDKGPTFPEDKESLRFFQTTTQNQPSMAFPKAAPTMKASQGDTEKQKFEPQRKHYITVLREHPYVAITAGIILFLVAVTLASRCFLCNGNCRRKPKEVYMEEGKVDLNWDEHAIELTTFMGAPEWEEELESVVTGPPLFEEGEPFEPEMAALESAGLEEELIFQDEQKEKEKEKLQRKWFRSIYTTIFLDHEKDDQMGNFTHGNGDSGT